MKQIAIMALAMACCHCWYHPINKGMPISQFDLSYDVVSWHEGTVKTITVDGNDTEANLKKQLDASSSAYCDTFGLMPELLSYEVEEKTPEKRTVQTFIMPVGSSYLATSKIKERPAKLLLRGKVTCKPVEGQSPLEKP